jgi:allophanate hydrolase subunit 2
MIGSSVDRMACQLDTKSELAHTIDRLSSPTYVGAVQCTPSGKLLILMRDSQTTGGYPRLLQCTKHSVNRLAQIRPNQRLKFVLND